SPLLIFPPPPPHRSPHSFPTRRSSDLFANSVPTLSSDTNRPWAWMGQAYHCVTNSLTITNQPNVSAFLVLGTPQDADGDGLTDADRKSTRLNSSHDQISYAVFCLKKKK